MNRALPVATAAAELGVPPGTVRRWVREGAPVAQRGRRGRGQALLVDPEAIRGWRLAGERQQIALELAGQIPEILARAAAESLQLAQGLDKHRLAGILAGAWYLGASAVLDHLRGTCAAVPLAEAIPEPVEITALRKIAR